MDAFMDAAEVVSENYAIRVGELENVDAVAHLDEDEGRVWVEVSGETVLPLGGTVRITQTSYATLEQFRPDTRESS
ncbi:MAG: hypothetical protein L0H93_15845 [Nocardioides sp.]|nr:hypothetical protein [Nocardioides sp.]